MTAFRLATVERLRHTRLQECAQALAEASAALKQAQQRRMLLVELLHAHGGASATASQFITGGHFRDRLRGQLEQLVGETAQLEAARDAARTSWLEARSQLRAVEALHERHRAHVRAEQGRREQRELDDLAGRGPERVGGDVT